MFLLIFAYHPNDVFFVLILINLRLFPTKLRILGLSALLFLGCSGVKKLQEIEILLLQNNVVLDGKKLGNDPVKKLIRPQPNSTLLSIPIKRNLYLRADKQPDSLFDHWLNEDPNRKNRLEKLWSPKQLYQLKKYKIGWNQWLIDNGEPPAFID
ncbi:MAG: hypothetical protein VW892_01225, partial [Flavobacteriaceae bacterium]